MITKEEILKRVSQEDIMQKYFPEKIEIGRKYLNPFRNDTSPDCYFHYTKGVLIFMDFARSEYNGDCFKMCMNKERLDFINALKKIDKDFNLNIQVRSLSNLTQSTIINPIVKIEIPEEQENIIRCKYMGYNKHDEYFWKQYGISVATLRKFNVYSCFQCWISKTKESFTYTLLEPIYAFILKKGIEYDKIKIYRPKSYKKEKWRTNASNSIVQGWKQLPETGELLIITKSLKDVMALYELGYNSVAFGGETSYPQEEINILKSRFKQIIVFYDNDIAGIKGMKEIYKRFKLPYWYIPTSYIEKDATDFIYKHGTNKFKEIFLRETLF
jgi:DNA primase